MAKMDGQIPFFRSADHGHTKGLLRGNASHEFSLQGKQYGENCYVSHIRNQQLLNKIGKKVKSIREDAGLTQEEVFNDTGIHIGRIETATSNITVSTLEALCKYFKVGLDTFFINL